jgi:type IV pilus assembly protein PilO
LNAAFEKILDRPKSQKVGILVGLIIFLSAAFYSIFYSPQAEEIAKLNESIEAAHNEKSIKQKRAANLPRLQKELGELDVRLKEAMAQLPSKKEIADLLTSIATKAQESGLDIHLFRPRPETYKDFYAEIPVEINIKGTFHNVIMFFDGVGQLTRLVNIDNVGFKNPKITGDQVMLEFTTTATTYRFLEETERKRIAEEKAKAAKGAK